MHDLQPCHTRLVRNGAERRFIARRSLIQAEVLDRHASGPGRREDGRVAITVLANNVGGCVCRDLQ